MDKIKSLTEINKAFKLVPVVITELIEVNHEYGGYESEEEEYKIYADEQESFGK